MKIIFKIPLTLICIFALLCTSVSALADDGFSWYCKRNKSHSQPEIDAEMSFIEELDGFYVDRKYADSEEKVIYLTFDAGYENGNVEKILDILKAENAKASFFVLENLLTKHCELVKRMVNDGHLVGNHTATHKDISKLNYNELKEEVERLEILYKQVIGREMPKYFRPPEGRFSRESMKNLQQLGYKTVFWSFAYADWDNHSQPEPEKAYEKVMSNIHNGAILLLHPTSDTNVQILPRIIKSLKSQGYSFKTVDGLKKLPI